jgi:uncharacterized protein DUF6221
METGTDSYCLARSETPAEHAKIGSTMDTVTDLTSFLHDRWDDEERNTVLHELDCPVPHETGRTSRCYCPGPAQILARIATHREISRHCEQRIRHEQDDGPCWPLDSTLAFQSMKALTHPYELHPAFQDTWYP